MRRLRNAKIVATLGPASTSPEIIDALFEAGADVFRLNFSHGSHDDHRQRLDTIRAIEQQRGRPIGVLLDLQGPKLRIGTFADGPIQLAAQASFRLDLDGNTPGSATRVSLPHPEIFAALREGAELLLDDGKIRLRVERCGAEFAETTVINGGPLSDRKGVNVPGVVLPLSAMTEKDRRDLDFGLTLGVDWIALSFVQRAEDIEEIKAIVQGRAGIVAKLEKPAAIQSLEAIVAEADAVMVARGDLGVEMPPEKVPAIQKHVIRRAGEYRKPVITATQMLESMIENPRPTRAEASDVANAIYDGTDAVMLSAESAAGKYPVEAVKMMAKIVSETESQLRETNSWDTRPARVRLSIAETICESAAHAAEDLDVSAVAVFTETGTTARQLSKYRPKPPIYALSSVDPVINRMAMLWGVHPIRCPKLHTAEEMVDHAETVLEQRGFVKPKEIMGIVAGTRTRSGSTNFLRLHVLGDRVVENPPPAQKAERAPRPVKKGAVATRAAAGRTAVRKASPTKVAAKKAGRK